MSTFIDGPAKDCRLSFARAPYFLRMVCDATGKWDGLDQITDTPEAGEKIFVYRKVSDDGVAFVDGRDPKTGKRFGGYRALATYRFVEPQPDDATMRSSDSWNAWCLKTYEAWKAAKEGATTDAKATG